MPGNTNPSDRLPETQGLRHKPVYSQADFGTFFLDEVELEDGVWYDLKDDFELSSGGLRCPAGAKVVICAACPGTYTITYTNTAKPMFLASGSRDMQLFNFDVVFNSGTRDVFDLTGDGAGSLVMQSFRVFVTASSGAGKIDSYADARLNAFELRDSAGELLFRDCNTSIAQSVFNNSVDSSGALIAFESTAPFNFEVFNSRLTPRPNESAIRISSSTQDPGSRFLATDLITGAPVGLLFESGDLDEEDPRVETRDCPGRTPSGVFGQGNLDDNGLTTDIPAVNAWVLFNATTWDVGQQNRVSGTSGGAGTFTGLDPTRIKLDGNVVMHPLTATKFLAATYVKIGKEAISVTFDNTTNTFTAAGLSNGDSISFFNTPGTLPAEIRADVVYYVVGTSDQLAYTEGGSAIAFTDDGTGPNNLDLAEIFGSRSPISIISSRASEVVIQALTVVDTDEKIAIAVRNVSDAVDLKVLHAYSRV